MAEVAQAPARSDRPGGPEVRDLAVLSRRGLAYNLAYLMSAWALALGAVAVFWTWPSVGAFVLAFVVVSSRQQALLNVEHECVHGTFVRGRRWNERIGSALCAAPCASPFNAARARHLAHHRLLGADGDPDADLHRGEDKLTPAGVLRHFVLGVAGVYALTVLFSRSGVAIDRDARRRDLIALLASQIVAAALLWLLFAWWIYPVLWLFPLATLTVVCHLLRNFCEHALAPAEEHAHGDRLISVRSNPLERALVAPFFMNYHAEHHLFPWIPARRLPEARQRVASVSGHNRPLLRSSYIGSVLRYVRALP
jgi:fatty acid desaturase